MDSLLITNLCSPPLAPPSSSSSSSSTRTRTSSFSLRLPRRFPLLHGRRRVLGPERSSGIPHPAAAAAAGNGALVTSSVPPNNGVFTVGDFMTKREELHTVKPTTTVDEALQKLVENRITGFPVIDDDWNLVGVVSDYDLLALDSISGTGRTDTSLFPEADSTWKTFNEIQRLLSKTNGKVIGELMTPVPLVVRETTNLEDAAKLLLETKYRRLPVVDSAGKLVGIITRGNVVRAALEIKRAIEKSSKA